jgi:GNAT superfamily N-acetyltransferase
MVDLHVRATVVGDISTLVEMNHGVESEGVWQLEIHREARQVHARFHEVRLPRATSVVYPHDPYALADTWRSQSRMFTAVVDARPVGYIALMAETGTSLVWITGPVVDPLVRRHGIGLALLGAAQRWAVEQSHSRLLLELSAKNLPALRLAQKSGFEFCGYNDRYYLTQDVAIFFSKTILRSD